MKLGQRKFEQLALKLQTEEVTELRLQSQDLAPAPHLCTTQPLVKEWWTTESTQNQLIFSPNFQVTMPKHWDRTQ